VTGELMQMANGPLGMAAGVEYRREDYNDVSDPVLTLGDVLGRGSRPRSASATSLRLCVQRAGAQDGRAAARRPHRPLQRLRQLLHAQVRVRWTPTRELLLRATYAKGFRAPSIPESGESNSFFFQTLETRAAAPSTRSTAAAYPRPAPSRPIPTCSPKSDSWTVGFVFEPSQA
jgi:iron complex outermembrane receptor protein